ncbi:MAG: DUF3605 domain-containing protein [FCB group bacterium]|nr:DUF3605 domain-containing protein [FCB group bacterium]
MKGLVLSRADLKETRAGRALLREIKKLDRSISDGEDSGDISEKMQSAIDRFVEQNFSEEERE